MQTGYKRIGILGGTFNPIHAAHIQMAIHAKARLGLDTVLLIPANDPPHKQIAQCVSAERRYQMVRLAAAESEGLAACDIEIKRAGKSYTIDTLLALQAQYPAARLFVLMGSDMLHDLPNWHRAEDLLHAACFVGFKRQTQPGNDAHAAMLLHQKHSADVLLLDCVIPPISSTDIRKRVSDAQPVDALLPAGVMRYIFENALYFTAPLANKARMVRGMLSEARYAHTVGVMTTSIMLADTFGADTRKARLAALLHDIGRSKDKGALTHAATGAELARTQFQVRDESVLRAIRLHTTLGQDADLLSKVIYLADMIEPGREYPGVEALRALAAQDINKAVQAGLQQTVSYVKSRGQQVHPDSLRALQSFAQAEPIPL